MDARTRKMLIEDFTEWSGGFPPESDRDIQIYSTYARPYGTEAEEVSRVLPEEVAGIAPRRAGRFQ